MSPIAIVSVISLIGWLILVSGNPELRQMGISKRVLLAVAWIGIFILVALVMAEVM